MSSKTVLQSLLVLLCAVCVAGSALAQMPNPYGPPISLEMARKVAAPALAEAAKNNWAVAVAIVDPSGNLVYYEKMDNTQLASAHVAVEKARTAATYKRPPRRFKTRLLRALRIGASSACREWLRPRVVFRWSSTERSSARSACQA